jgi:uroporphyrinogen decarboxylase
MSKRLLHVATGKEADRTPIWLMRQAGRYLKGYQGLRKKYGFLELCKNSQLAAEISLEPFKQFGMDGVILFSDIMIPAEAMGIKLDFAPGPIIEHPIRTEADIKKLIVADPHEKTSFVLDTLKMLRSEIADRSTLIGFSGCPFTVAAYCVEGKHINGFPTYIKWMKEDPKRAHTFFEKLNQTILANLEAQIDSGAEVIQIFDSATYLLSPEDYETFAMPYEKKLLDILKAKVPTILYIRQTERFVSQLKRLEAPIISVDHTLDMGEASAVFSNTTILQGNLHSETLRDGPVSKIEAETRKILSTMANRRHIFNLGHGVLKETPVDHVSALVECVQNYVN